jgi:beta-phosphoglucomutase
VKIHSLPLPEAVIFDFDGIIVDTEPLHYKAFLAVLDPLGLGFPWEEYVATYMGFDDRDAFREAFRRKGRDLDGVSLRTLVAAKSRVFLDILRAGVEPYPGAVPMIESLHAAGVPLAISSGALRSDIMPILGGLGVEGCFPVIVTADDVRTSKPDPECYALAFRRLAELHPSRVTAPARSFAIEDTPAGIRSAKGAGLQVLAVTNSYGAGELAEADWVADSLENVRVS